MTRATHKTSVSLLLGTPVRDHEGEIHGSVVEFAVSPETGTDIVSTLVLRGEGKRRISSALAVSVGQIGLVEGGEIHLRPGLVPTDFVASDNLLMLERDLLDQQIIDVHGHKVVRVNDVDLEWENVHEESGSVVLRIQEVEIGLRGAVRRLLKGIPGVSIDGFAARFRPNVISWDLVDLIERDPARRVRLTIGQDRLSKMHPSDIADILEDLAPTERRALFESLDEEIAAEALEEVKPKMQQTLIESLDSETVAGIVEEMDPGAAADLLSEMPEERSEAILEEMNPEERREVEDLLVFAGDTAAGQMTTEYLLLRQEATVSDVKELLRQFDGDVELLSDVYLSDNADRICGVIPIVQIVLAGADAALEELPHGHLVTCEAETAGRKVAELFDKYNLRSLPVVDKERHLVGVVHAEQVIASLRGKG